jgi:hypothetical protein
VDAAAGSVEEVARIVAHIRRKWPRVRILLRADSGFARDELMAWCEANGVHFVFGLAQNDRLNAEIMSDLEAVKEKSERTGKPRTAFQGVQVDDAQKLEPQAPGCCQSRVDERRCQSSLRCYLTQTCRVQTPLPL